MFLQLITSCAHTAGASLRVTAVFGGLDRCAGGLAQSIWVPIGCSISILCVFPSVYESQRVSWCLQPQHLKWLTCTWAWSISFRQRKRRGRSTVTLTNEGGKSNPRAVRSISTHLHHPATTVVPLTSAVNQNRYTNTNGGGGRDLRQPASELWKDKKHCNMSHHPLGTFHKIPWDVIIWSHLTSLKWAEKGNVTVHVLSNLYLFLLYFSLTDALVTVMLL